ncbi:MAG TPA: hypothetical protein VJY85_09380 [Candidatus Limnocylindria bacterium]|nr:hypothetical protein [Candidatus Limnocylindria bacterium]
METGEWEALLRRQDGIVSRQQAMRFLSENTVDRRVASGRWQLVHRGVYATHNGTLTQRQTLWAASLSTGAGRPAVLGGVTALCLQGLQRFTPQYVHVVVPAHRRARRPPPGVRVHRTSHLAIEHVCPSLPPTTSPARSVVDAAGWAKTEAEARTIIAMCFQQRLVIGDEVENVARQMPVAKRRSLILRSAADARGGAHSLAELDLVALCRAAGLPVPVRQVMRRDAAGNVRYLDVLWPWGVRAEIDGSHHMSAEQWWADMRRHNDLSRRGEVVLRFPAWLVRDSPMEVAETIRRALRDAGWS